MILKIEELLTSGKCGAYHISRETRIPHQLILDYCSGKLDVEDMRTDRKERLYEFAVKFLDEFVSIKVKLERYIEENGMMLREGVTIEEDDDASSPHFIVDGELKLGTRGYKSMFFRMKKDGWIVKAEKLVGGII